ncbi:MAG: tetratricopeptide repeat protein, partial [Pirellulales bacterium]
MTFANSTWAPAGVMALVLFAAGAPLAGQETPKAGSPPAAVRQFRDAVAFQDRGVYDLAADEWQKFLTQFSTDPLAPKALHYLGVCRLLLKQHDAAVESFQRVIREHPTSELADSSYLNLGLAQYSIAQAGKPESYDQAAKTFRTLADKFPKSKELPQALYYQGEALYARGHKDEAAKTYEQLVEKYPQSPLLADGLYALGVARQDLGNTDEAAAAFDRFVKEFPSHKLRAEVIMRRAETLFTQGRFDAAGQWFASAAASKDFKLADLAALRQAQSLEAAKKFVLAAPLYATVQSRFPNSAYGPSALLAAGNCYAQSGDLDSAVKSYQAVIEGGGELSDDAAHWLARAYLKKNKPAEALAALEQILPKSKGTDFAVQLLLDRADAVYEIPARRAEAIGLYAALAAEYPNDPLAPQALYMAAFASLGRADYKAAASYCDRFLSAYADKPLAADVRYVAAESALQLKEYDRADRRYAELVEKYPDHVDVDAWKMRRALSLHLQAKFADVVALLAPLAGRLKSPELVAEAQYLLGSAHGELGQQESAVKALGASLAAGPRGKHADQALLALAAVQRQTNHVADAIVTLAKLSREFPDSKLVEQASYRSGEYALTAGDLAAAAGHYRHVVATWPDSPLVPHALYGLAWTQLAAKDYAAASTSLSRLLEQYPKHAVAAKARYARAMAREQQMDYTGAGDDVASFLATDPPPGERSDALYVQGLCFAGLKEFDKAAEAFRAILTTDPKFAGADKVLYELAWALRSADKPREALEAFATLAREHENSPLAAESLYHLGEDAYQSGDYDRAAAHYQSARSKAGAGELGEKAAHKLGWSLYQQGQLEPAARSFETQLADFPQGPLAADAQFMIAEALYGRKQYAAALLAYQKSFDRPTANKELQALAHLHAGQSLAQEKKWSESFELLDKAVGSFPDSTYLPELRYESGWAQQNLGNPDDALERYEQVVAQTDREVAARARFMIGEILFEKRQYKEAIRNFFKVAYGYGYPESPETVRVWQANAS